MKTSYTIEDISRIAETRTRRAILASLETMFHEEFSDVSKAVMAATFAGLVSLVKDGEFAACKILVNGIISPPPGVTVERMEEVKALIISKIP